MMDLIEKLPIFLWNIALIIGAIMILWGLWQIIQIVRNLREYGLDYIGFMRGDRKKQSDHIETIAKKKEDSHHLI